MAATRKNKKSRLGLFGGTFDPLHYGHLIAAQNALESLELEQVVFVPAGKPPHKCNWKISPPLDRYKMVKLGIAGSRHFAVSDIELSSNCASYTVESLKKVRSIYPDSELYLLMGLDQALTLSSWRDPEGIFKMARVVVMVRPGYRTADIQVKWRKKIILLPIPLIEISASNIRERASRGSSIEFLVPGRVGQYISKQGLYRK